MANAQLNFNEAELDQSSDLYHLYDRLYQGMVKANEVDPPAFPSSEDLLVLDENGNPVFDSNGEPVLDAEKQAQVSQVSSDYATILMKNSAYLFAHSILSVMNGGSGGGGGNSNPTGFVYRGGDSMTGALSAWYGFDAGVNGQKIFEVTINADDKSLAIVHGGLQVTKTAEITGLLYLTEGVAFGGNKAMYLEDNKLVIEYQDIFIKGAVEIDESLTLGDVVINQNGIFWDDHEFYHSGNANKPEVDWTMKNATVHGNLTVALDASISGKLTVADGFSLGVDKLPVLYSEIIDNINEEGETTQIVRTVLNSDLRIINGHGIKFNEHYIINVRNNQVVSFSAPGMIMNLGDSDNGTLTSKISLQSGVWEYSNTYQIISPEGAGNFVNGLRARCAPGGSVVLETFRMDANHLGVVFQKQIRFGSTEGTAIYQDVDNGWMTIQMPYINGEVEGHPVERLGYNMYFAQTTSPFRNLSLDWSATLHFTTDGEFFAFDQPIEANFFAIKSDRYHTRLIEDALFFDDGKFIEGVTDGLRYAGNGYFDGSISSPSYASGFVGYGWAVKDEITNGGFHATFDALTVRKKMRVYELEVQKLSCTNGSLWVSDFCSGDEVIALQ